VKTDTQTKNKKIYFRKGVNKMKKFTKLFLSCAAVAAVTAAVATSAMAADKTLTATYNDPADGAATTTVSIDCASTDETKTLVIVSGTDITTIDTAKVIQIDQGATITSAIVSASLEDGTYTVLMGGTSGDIYKGTFRIGAGGILLGDVDFNEKINLTDATKVVGHATKVTTLEGDAFTAADVDLNEKVNLTDATCIVKYAVKLTEGTAHVGETN
jgi:methionine-rich copper-binding protein CopC